MADPHTGSMVTLSTPEGDTFQAYVAGDEAADKAMLMFHEWWGLKDHNREWADALARRGYRCIALDLYDGRVTDNAEEASHWMQALDQERIDARTRALLAVLGAGHRPVATLGYSMGGKQAMRVALMVPGAVHAVALGYCRLETDPTVLAPLTAPVFVVYAEQERAWPEKQTDFARVMDELGKVTRAVSFDAAHGFVDPNSHCYNHAASKSAWKATLAFLDSVLTEQASV